MVAKLSRLSLYSNHTKPPAIILILLVLVIWQLEAFSYRDHGLVGNGKESARESARMVVFRFKLILHHLVRGCDSD
jgi:hypothetical protein